MTQLADAPINLVSLADPLLAEIFEYVGTPGVGKLALTCTDFRRVAGETMKTREGPVPPSWRARPGAQRDRRSDQ